jgi:transposase InsO family protein
MNVHQNARLTVSCRVLLVERILSGRAQGQVAAELGISVRTATKWLKRYQDLGTEGLKDRSSRPHRSPQATDEVLRSAVVALRRQRLTLITIATQLNLSRATVARIAKAEGLNRLSKLEPAPVYRRYERAEPGELLHLDIKKLGRIVKVGHRITGDRRGHKGRNIGWDYLHVAIDDASRVAYAQILPDEDASCCVAFLRAAVAYYAGLGVRIKGVYTDNGKAYRGRDFASTCSLLGLTISTQSPTPRAPMARPSASSKAACASGPMRVRTGPPTSAAMRCPSGYTATTGTDPTPAWPASHPFTDWVSTGITC